MSVQSISQDQVTTAVREKGYFEFNPSMWMAKIVSSDLNTPGLENLAKKVAAMIGYIIALLCTGGLFFALDFALNGQPAVIKKEEANVTSYQSLKNECEKEKEWIFNENRKKSTERSPAFNTWVAAPTGEISEAAFHLVLLDSRIKRHTQSLEESQNKLLEAKALLAEACPAPRKVEVDQDGTPYGLKATLVRTLPSTDRL